MAPIKEHIRWAAWENAILSTASDPLKCQEVILQRQMEADGDQDEADLVVAELRRRLRRIGKNPEHLLRVSSVQSARGVGRAGQTRKNARNKGDTLSENAGHFGTRTSPSPKQRCRVDLAWRRSQQGNNTGRLRHVGAKGG